MRPAAAGSRLERGRPAMVRARLERWVLGLGMGLVAFVIERRVLRKLRSRATHRPSPGRVGDVGRRG
ncbi:MAG TPA: hypothetical protein VNO79_08010 [Actinomycetota bacterium]|nr:hypothetical protein [Actinomycetota bacterium]